MGGIVYIKLATAVLSRQDIIDTDLETAALIIDLDIKFWYLQLSSIETFDIMIQNT